MRKCIWTAGAVASLLLPSLGAAQAAETGPKVGDLAPDFTLAGATRYGLLKDHINLRSYRGNTVVLAFFFKARTRG